MAEGNKRESVGEKKLIIGVPVLPGLPLQTETTIRDPDVDSVSSSTMEVRYLIVAY